MTEEQVPWNKEKAQKYSDMMEKVSKRVYIPFAKRIVDNLGPSKRDLIILDLSTGPGFLSIELHGLLPDARIIGVDSSSDMLQIAKRNAEKAGISNFETKLGKAEEISLDLNSIDLVVNLTSLHDWENPKKAFLEILRVLKPGGKLILKDSNRNCPKWKLGLFHLLVSIMYGREIAKGHSESYKTAFTFEEVVDLLKEANFAEIKGEGKGLDLFVQALKR
ncbi:MAG: class I SAM-dependent methyltransferase [Candidatus Aminicenantes bacterium]|nr:class I SAM-dependent methyltransferase [Candidatus Aminicenantes bacterium]